MRRNVIKILKTDISVKDLKHIVAIINVMQHAGMNLESPILYNNSIGRIECRVDHNFQRQSKRIVFDIPDERFKADGLLSVIKDEVAEAIYRAMNTGIKNDR